MPPLHWPWAPVPAGLPFMACCCPPLPFPPANAIEPVSKTDKATPSTHTLVSLCIEPPLFLSYLDPRMDETPLGLYLPIGRCSPSDGREALVIALISISQRSHFFRLPRGNVAGAISRLFHLAGRHGSTMPARFLSLGPSGGLLEVGGLNVVKSRWWSLD